MYDDSIFGKSLDVNKIETESPKVRYYTFDDSDYVTIYEPEIKDTNNGFIVAYYENDKYYIDVHPCKYLNITYTCELNEDLYRSKEIEFNQLHPMYTYAIFQHLKNINVNECKGKILKYNVFATICFDIVITNADDPNDSNAYKYKDYSVV